MSEKGHNVEIREVWKHIISEEMKQIREIVKQCNYIALDTEFAGQVVKHPISPYFFDYETLKANVEQSKLIQLGLTFTDDQSIPKNRRDSVSEEELGSYLVPSGAVLSDEVRWITFQGGYDVGYMLKVLSGKKELPETEEEFLENMYDVRFLVKFTTFLHGGLDKIARDLEVERVGSAHQAASDSLLTSRVFMKLKYGDYWCKYYGEDGKTIMEKRRAVLFGLGVDDWYMNKTSK